MRTLGAIKLVLLDEFESPSSVCNTEALPLDDGSIKLGCQSGNAPDFSHSQCDALTFMLQANWLTPGDLNSPISTLSAWLVYLFESRQLKIDQ